MKPDQRPLTNEEIYALTNKYPIDGSGAAGGYPGNKVVSQNSVESSCK